MYSDKNFKQKYLKYKMKYLELKNSYLNIEMKGGNTINLSDSTFSGINWSSELLVEKINSSSTNNELKKKLLELSFTDKFSSDEH
jgi:hypothetical protein